MAIYAETNAQAVPEPATIASAALGIGLILAARRRRSIRRAAA